jgi:hypothetical protein
MEFAGELRSGGRSVQDGFARAVWAGYAVVAGGLIVSVEIFRVAARIRRGGSGAGHLAKSYFQALCWPGKFPALSQTRKFNMAKLK